MKPTKMTEWILRIAVAGEFLGHGVFALQGKEGWIKYFTAVSISPEMAVKLMSIIGVVDVTLAVLILVRPVRILVLWMAFWGFLTALIRPIGGDPIWDFIERFANIGAPLALLSILGWPKKIKEWFIN